MHLGNTDRQPIRCDHCRKPFGLVLHRYFRMRFCSANCLGAYQQRLDKLTRVKLEQLSLAYESTHATSQAA